MGGVSLGTMLEVADPGVGIVRWTVCSGLRMWVEVIQAPVALMLRVFVSSTNSAPDTSVPLRNTGTCKRMRGERRVDEVSTSCPFFCKSVFK